ncbi:hypothetical protein SAMN05444161_7348 [Rhizobiales bacterium GAS191]|jgi:hypothetical protein|nr:hypothetical protein SAMN05444161_7348 [Rhizobiales bacterium GAS191]
MGPAPAEPHISSDASLRARERERVRRSEETDRDLEDSFPASDPPSSTPITGVGAPSEETEAASEPAPGKWPDRK